MSARALNTETAAPACRTVLAASPLAVAALEAQARAAAELEAQIAAEREAEPPAKAKGPAATPPKDPQAAALAAEVARLISAVDDEPDASGWSPKRDALLRHLRKDKGLAWAAISVPARDGRFHSERKCQKRLQLLEAAASGARIARVVAAEPLPSEDGVEWLTSKGRLSPRRRAAALHYRDAVRDAGGALIKSSLADLGMGGGGDPRSDARLVGYTDAKRELFVLRWVVLGGQDDLLTVMDGVCARGHTLRQMAADMDAPGDVKARARVLEAILMVALDLVAKHLEAREGRAAEPA